MRSGHSFFWVLFIISCTNEKSAEITEAEICSTTSFSKDIKPIINTRCAITGCHLPGFQPGDLTTYDSIRKKVDAGTFRLRVIDTKSMPPLNPLNENDIKIIACWLDSGAKNN